MAFHSPLIKFGCGFHKKLALFVTVFKARLMNSFIASAVSSNSTKSMTVVLGRGNESQPQRLLMIMLAGGWELLPVWTCLICSAQLRLLLARLKLSTTLLRWILYMMNFKSARIAHWIRILKLVTVTLRSLRTASSYMIIHGYMGDDWLLNSRVWKRTLYTYYILWLKRKGRKRAREAIFLLVSYIKLNSVFLSTPTAYESFMR